ncbi:FG-GAP repeat domain-containing protein [Streptomyces sp. NPDC007355]|uniref:FG-GAP repeat domain-containing protein n=1 Tax=Streptomyces sp. NPDC007355 TaxID=3364778 RepID=UPI00369E087B
MRHITAPRRRVVTAVTAVLAATLGAATLSAPTATAATSPATPVTWHDFNGNGMPDIIIDDYRWVDATRVDTKYDPATGKITAGDWDTIDIPVETLHASLNVATGNLGGSAVGDFVSRDTAGVLQLRKGRGDGTFTAPIRVGTGWNTYKELVGGSDVTGDGKPDLLGVSKATGELFLHTGTGKDTAPFLAARKNLGKGWGVYRSVAGVGNLAGAPAGDVVAVDAYGTAWLHLGKGDGTFAPRTKISTGWGDYRGVFGVGDINRDGHPDLVGRGWHYYDDVALKVHLGTGDWRAPFKDTAAQEIGVWGDAAPYLPRPF